MRTPTDAADRLLDTMCAGRHQGVADLCDETVRLRAALPTGVVERDGPVAVSEAFQSWFGRTELIASEIGERDNVGTKTRLRWRLLVSVDWHPAIHVIEQVCFVKGRSSIRSIDLTCSGFLATEQETPDVPGAVRHAP